MKAELVLGNLKREREALNGKLERLENALNKEWQDSDQEYLCSQQYNAMSLYAHILDERILDIEMKLTQKRAKDEVFSNHETSHKDIDPFNNNSDLNCYKIYVQSKDSNDENCDNRSSSEIVLDIIKEIFGEDIFNGEQE